MEIAKPKPFHFLKLNPPIKVGLAGMYGRITREVFVVIEHQFPGLTADVQIFNNRADAMRMAGDYNRDCDVYTSYSVEKRKIEQ